MVELRVEEVAQALWSEATETMEARVGIEPTHKGIDLPEGYDLASFAHYGSGRYRLSILTGKCSHDARPIPKLRACDVYREWLYTQLEKHGIEQDKIQEATLEIDVDVQKVNVRSSYGHRFADAHFYFDCRSEITTDEQTYAGHMAGGKTWGFDWFYEKLYGTLPEVWPPATWGTRR